MLRSALLGVLVIACAAPCASAAVGDQLALFTPTPSGDGRGIAVLGASSDAYYSTADGANVIDRVNLATHASEPILTTTLGQIDPGRAFGALAYDAASGTLWAAEYAGNHGLVDRVDRASGAVTRMFDAHDLDPANTGIDGLAVAQDGSLWLSADGLGTATTTIYHITTSGGLVGSFSVGMGNSGLAVDGATLWLADINNHVIAQYDKSGTPTGLRFPTPGVDPEGLSVDTCTFPGRTALWTNSAGFGASPLAAYDIGPSSNTSCPAPAGGPVTTGIPDPVVIRDPGGIAVVPGVIHHKRVPRCVLVRVQAYRAATLSVDIRTGLRGARGVIVAGPAVAVFTRPGIRALCLRLKTERAGFWRAKKAFHFYFTVHLPGRRIDSHHSHRVVIMLGR
jgi:DNA-binding beta-propeller fold protein YncE